MTVSMTRRNAIAAGLRPWLPEEQIAVALQNLEPDSAFNLQRFVDHICERLAPACDRRQLHRSLVQSVFLGEQSGPGAAAEQAGDATQTRVFGGLLGAFLGLLAGQRSPAEAAVRGYLLERLDRFTLSATGRLAVGEWLGGRRRDIGVPLEQDAMRQMVNISYVLACEYLGPVIADRLLAQAVKEAERLPESRQFAPRALL